ncbi:MAG TPA: hypothetical protein VGV37_09565, partial [Aliidongia sp.]|uniref:hypothetical protein n=1 Tax=Aliidongia sp. TaxID=1914230 RepID=UPI002DDD4705
ILTVYSAVAWLGAMMNSAWRRRWRRVASGAIAPVFGIAAPLAYYYSGISPRFLIERPRMEHAIEAGAAREGARYQEFHWEETGFAGIANTSAYMVYDETDAIPSMVEAGKTKWPAQNTTVTRMGNHFYLVRELLD